MGNFIIKPTKNTPLVNFESDKGKLVIEGKSYPNDSVGFFEPIFNWFENYTNDKIEIKIKLEYFNTSTCKQLLSLLRLVLDNNESNIVNVKWLYEENDLDVLEIGQHMQEILNIKFEFNSYIENKISFI